MAAPSFADISHYSQLQKTLINKAIAEFLDLVAFDASTEDVMNLAYRIGRKYKLLSSELGAQWYEYCAKLAGIDVDPADLLDYDEAYLNSQIDDVFASDNINKSLDEFVRDMVVSTARDTGNSALWRDYERGMQGARWARVPVGETCAWCLMLASQGAWYHSEETALGLDPDHYHRHCDCVAVYFADAEEISGYNDLLKYKEMYYNADNAVRANANGTNEYPEELAERISVAHEEHDLKYKEALARGEKPRKWTKYNEVLILMRYQNGLQH